MFEFIRSHKRWMQVLLALLIVPSFVFVGVSSYGSGSDGGPEVANVGGQKVTQRDWDAAQREQMERYRTMMGDQFDQKLFETPEAKRAILESLVAQRALDAEIKSGNMTVGDAALQESILAIEAFKKPDGSFDMERYKQVLAAQGMSPSMFDATMRRDLALAQLNNAIQSSAFVPRTVAARVSDISDQQREVQEQLFPAAQYQDQVKVSDAMLKAYYDKNPSLFQVPEQVTVEYVMFDQGVAESQSSVTDIEIAAAYENNQKNFTTPEQRKASHILITVDADAGAAAKTAAKEKAQAVLARVRAAPGSFAELAKAESQDPSSAELGGDLGPIIKDGLPAPVEAVVYKLKQGEISDVVESEYGYHIVTVTSVTPATTKPLADVRDQIAGQLKSEKVGKAYSKLAEKFTNTVYEQSDSLKPVADQLGLQIQTIDKLTRTPNPALGNVPFNHPKFLAEIFSEEALKNKRNTEAVEVAPRTLIAGRVVKHTPAAKRPLAEVESLIRQRVVQEEAAKLARQAGEAKLATVKQADDASGFGPSIVVARTQQPTIHPTGAIAVLKADVSTLPAYVGVDLPGIGYGVYRISKVSQPATPDAARRASEQEQITNLVAQQEMYAYVEALKKKADAKLLIKSEGK